MPDNQGPSFAPRLNKRQKRIADVVRQALKVDSFDDQPMAYGLGEFLAILIDGINHSASPNAIGPVMQLVWDGYLQLAVSEQRSNLDVILGDRDRVRSLEKHPQMPKILSEIFSRTGPIVPGQPVPEINIDDLVKQYDF